MQLSVVVAFSLAEVFPRSVAHVPDFALFGRSLTACVCRRRRRRTHGYDDDDHDGEELLEKERSVYLFTYIGS